MKSVHRAFLEKLIEDRRTLHHPSDRAHLTEADLVRAQCKQFSAEFCAQFPELRMQAGFFGADPTGPDVMPDFSYVEHWWCVTPDGEIVDPTRAQFGDSTGQYWPYDENVHKIQIGRCINCGDYIYGLKKDGPASVCGLDCEVALEQYYGGEAAAEKIG